MIKENLVNKILEVNINRHDLKVDKMLFGVLKLSIYLSIHLSVCLSVYLYIYLSVSVFLSRSLPNNNSIDFINQLRTVSYEMQCHVIKIIFIYSFIYFFTSVALQIGMSYGHLG